MDRNVDLSVVIAAYNEEPIMDSSLRRVLDELKKSSGISWELICVNDGSSDRTGEILEAVAKDEPKLIALHHRRNFGQGRALRTAFDICRGDIIVTLDADLSYGPEYIFRLTEALEKENVEISLASAYMKGGVVQNVPFYRKFLSRYGNMYLAQMSNFDISTSTCVVRAYRRNVIDRLVLTSDGMELQLEILAKASQMGFRVCEIPAELVWSIEKKQHGQLKRTSKMRILKTIQSYLMMGWLSRPASLFIFLSFFVLIPGGYMTLVLFFRLMEFFAKHSSEGAVQAFTLALRELFSTYTYSLAFASILVLVGMQLLAFSMLILQNKYHFEEMCRIIQLSQAGQDPASKRQHLKEMKTDKD